jgi:hypothetical protein
MNNKTSTGSRTFWQLQMSFFIFKFEFANASHLARHTKSLHKSQPCQRAIIFANAPTETQQPKKRDTNNSIYEMY